MDRNVMRNIGSLALASLCFATSAQAQEFAPNSEAAFAARVDFGRGGGAGLDFRISVRGGAPGGAALLSARAAGASADEDAGQDGSGVATLGRGRGFYEWIALDGDGRGSLEVRGLHLDEGWRVRVHTRLGGRPVGSNWLWLPPAHGMPQGAETQRGDIIITEIMKDPTAVSDTQGEWFELYNVTARTINIEGWSISDDGSNLHVIDNNKNLVWLSPGQRIVLGNNADAATNGGVAVDYEYSGFSLSNGADEILLTARNGKLVDVVRYDDGVLWPDEPGKALNLDPNYHDAWRNDFYLRWCSAMTSIGSGPDTGTPGLPNDLCP